MSNTFKQIIYLIGARASGKTTVGKKLAKILDVPCYDLDEHICQKENASVSEIVNKKGWAVFRKLEHDSLIELTRFCKGKGIIATGGGIVLSHKNRNFMVANGKVIWLNASIDELHKRLQKDLLPDQRPALTGLSLLEEISHIVKEREPLYRACAHHICNSNTPAEEICEEIKNMVHPA